MDLPQLVSLECDASHTVSDISYDSGVLNLVSDYTTDMEGGNCTLNVTFDSSIIISPETSLSFTTVSDTESLVIVQYPSEY